MIFVIKIHILKVFEISHCFLEMKKLVCTQTSACTRAKIKTIEYKSFICKKLAQVKLKLAKKAQSNQGIENLSVLVA